MGGPSDGSPARLRILYEDEWVVAVDKQAGIIVHGDGTGTATLTDLVLRHLDDGTVSPREKSCRVQALQRLDRETTGIVLFSKCKETQAAFDRLIAERRIAKRYLAIVRGRFPHGTQAYHGAIGRDRHDSRRMRVSRTGRPALTEVRPLAFAPADAHGPARSLVAVDLRTGRRHQIRVHLSHAGFPILGDGLYGGARPAPERGTQPAGLMLHAARERFTHPVTGEDVSIEAPYPARFERLFPHGEAPGAAPL